MEESDADSLLLKAWFLPPEQAVLCWREWRLAADIENPGGRSLAMLPLLAHRLPEWLTGDPARGVLLGICRRCWSQNQLRLRELDEVVGALHLAAIGPVVLGGSAAWMVLHRPALRSIDSLEAGVPPDQFPQAAAILRNTGWAVGNEEQDGADGIWFDRGTTLLKLRPRSGLASRLESVRIRQEVASLPPPEDLLLDALGRYCDRGEVDWRSDALQLIRSRRVNWRRMRGFLRGMPAGLARLYELREQWSAAIPVSVFRAPSAWEVQWRRYRDRASREWRSRSAAGFAAYLLRWSWRAFGRAVR